MIWFYPMLMKSWALFKQGQHPPTHLACDNSMGASGATPTYVVSLGFVLKSLHLDLDYGALVGLQNAYAVFLFLDVIVHPGDTPQPVGD